MQSNTVLIPTLARYALLILGTKLTAGGWLPPAIAQQIANDPAILEMATGVAIAGGAVVWFCFSKAKAAILLLRNL